MIRGDGTRSRYYRIFMPDHSKPRYDRNNPPPTREECVFADLDNLELALEQRFQYDMLPPLMRITGLMTFPVKPLPVERGTYESIAKFEGDTDDRTAKEYVIQVKGHFAVGHITTREKQISEFRNYLGQIPKKWLKMLLKLWETQNKDYTMDDVFTAFEK